jgi:hypothetical protein
MRVLKWFLVLLALGLLIGGAVRAVGATRETSKPLTMDSFAEHDNSSFSGGQISERKLRPFPVLGKLPPTGTLVILVNSIEDSELQRTGRARLTRRWEQWREAVRPTPVQDAAVVRIVHDVQEELTRLRLEEESVPYQWIEARGPAEAGEILDAIEATPVDMDKYRRLRREMDAKLASVLDETQLDAWSIDLGELDQVGVLVGIIP